MLRTPPLAPQANSVCERLVGTIRRECLDFLIALGQRHLKHILNHWVPLQSWSRSHKPRTRYLGATLPLAAHFLANGWFERALSAQRDLDVVAHWWGRDDWKVLWDMGRDERKKAIVKRIKSEFNYKDVKAWEIFNRRDGGATMYYMIHATDHPQGPVQMSRAYRSVVRVGERAEQLVFWESESKPPTPDTPSGLQATA